MIQRFGRAALIAGAITAAMAAPSAAQLVGNLGALTAENAKGYLRPLPRALSSTLNSSVFQSADIPFAGINLSVGVAAIGVVFDKGDRTYRPTDPPGFTSTAPVDAPTVIGSPLSVTQTGVGGTTLFHPGGLDIDQFVLPVPQVTIGSVFGTRAVVRWVSVKAGDSDLGKVDLFGIGAQHSISHYIPGLPVNLAAGFMYQTLKIGKNKLIDTHGMHFDVTASKRFSVLEPYVSVGYDTFKMEANYTSDTVTPGQDINVKFDTESNKHLTAGLALRLPFMRIHGEVISAAQNGAAIGLDFGN